jgi:hypothetical protein
MEHLNYQLFLEDELLIIISFMEYLLFQSVNSFKSFIYLICITI